MSEEMLPGKRDHSSESAAVYELVDRREFAARLGVSKRTISRMVQRGELPEPCIGDGGRPRWLWDYVVTFLERQHVQRSKQSHRLNRFHSR